MPVIRPAGAGARQQVRRMLDKYLTELAQYGEVDLQYPWFDAYWQPGEVRWAYMLQDGSGQPAGFAMVNTHAPTGNPVDYAMAEFYVVPAKRGLGVGRAAVRDLLRAHPGTWELSAMRANRDALRFWSSALAAAGVVDLQVSEEDDIAVFRFRTGQEALPS